MALGGETPTAYTVGQYTELSKAVLQAYEQSALDAIFNDPLSLHFIQKYSTPCKPMTKWQRRKSRAKYRWRRLKGWRLRVNNTQDAWHKREDCDGW